MIEQAIKDYMQNLENISISPEEAIDKSMENLILFDMPIIGYSSCDDKMYDDFTDIHEITYGVFMHPKKWLPEAKTIISIFIPFSLEVVNSNIIDPRLPSNGWVHGRYEGQKLINKFTQHLVDMLTSAGYLAIAPSLDERFMSTSGYDRTTKKKKPNMDYTSNWSERHVAYASGLGTFGLSKGLITKKGMAGRFTSIITNYEHKITARDYTTTYEYCTRCGECVKQCPPNAITLKNGKCHGICSNYVKQMSEIFKPRYGCGKCQVNVPCSRSIPNA